MTQNKRTKPEGERPRVKIGSPSSVLAVVPALIGFHPDRSLVVLGIGAPRARVRMTIRFDLPDPPDPAATGEIVEHVRTMLVREGGDTAILIGYGPGPLVTPLVDSLGPALREAGIKIRDMLRVEDGRYWSYVCQDPRCCPPEGVAFDVAGHPLTSRLAASGLVPHRDRASMAATLDSDPELAARVAEAMELVAETMTAPKLTDGLRGGRHDEMFGELAATGRRLVSEALARYVAGDRLTEPLDIAWLGMLLSLLPVRDDAWARMDPAHHQAHRRLWIDLVRVLPQEWVPAPASLLAFVCWQAGDGAMATIAAERALKADPEYSMAHLISDAVLAGLPPAAARLPMTPEEVEASYAEQIRRRPRRPSRRDRGRSPAEPVPGPADTAAPPAATRRSGR